MGWVFKIFLYINHKQNILNSLNYIFSGIELIIPCEYKISKFDL